METFLCTPKRERNLRLSFRTGVPLRVRRVLDFRAPRRQAPKIVAGSPGECAMKKSVYVLLVVAALACIAAADIKGLGTLADTVVGAS
jgi:hypothetical protein